MHRVILSAIVLSTMAISHVNAGEAPVEAGYRGIWMTIGHYSGGLGTYTSHHVPVAIYAPAVDRTFFVWGGRCAETNTLLMMISYFDHKTGTVPRPRMVRDCGKFADPHANPSLAIAPDGRLWVFCATRHNFPAQVWRSLKPYDITSFEMVPNAGYIAYPQSWFLPDGRCFLQFTKYTGGRELYWKTWSEQDGWSADAKLAKGGHYAITAQDGNRIWVACDRHSGVSGPSVARSDLFLLRTDDAGVTWVTVDGKPLQPPLDFPDNLALVFDYWSQKRYVYHNDFTIDRDRNPVLLYVVSSGGHTDKKPREFVVARWDGKAWHRSTITATDHNYDHGSLWLEADGTWVTILPCEPGPQPQTTGGDLVMFTSRDRGATWTRGRQLTGGGPYNHTYVRRPIGAKPDFYAFWADGDTAKISPSRLYFCNRDGKVFRLPEIMTGDTARPDAVGSGH
jgi:hypothetical protein